MNLLSQIKLVGLKNNRLLNSIKASYNIKRYINAEPSKLIEIGIAKSKNIKGQYEVGQTFLHRLFDYRGVILFKWTFEKNTNDGFINETYYKCLIDNRDIGYINSLYQDENKEFLKFQLSNRRNLKFQYEHENDLAAYVENYKTNSKNIIDYVSSEDIIPYTSTEKVPIDNEKFEKYFIKDAQTSSEYTSSDLLKNLDEKNRKNLGLSDVYTGNSNNIKIKCIPFYMGIKETKTLSDSRHPFWWKYILRIENLREERIVLRYGLLFSENGLKVKEFGKDQESYLIDKNKDFATFQFSGNVFSNSPNDIIKGLIKIETENESIIDVKVPEFALKILEDDIKKPNS